MRQTTESSFSTRSNCTVSVRRALSARRTVLVYRCKAPEFSGLAKRRVHVAGASRLTALPEPRKSNRVKPRPNHRRTGSQAATVDYRWLLMLLTLAAIAGGLFYWTGAVEEILQTVEPYVNLSSQPAAERPSGR